jgi:hypothetical protein
VDCAAASGALAPTLSSLLGAADGRTAAAAATALAPLWASTAWRSAFAAAPLAPAARALVGALVTAARRAAAAAALPSRIALDEEGNGVGDNEGTRSHNAEIMPPSSCASALALALASSSALAAALAPWPPRPPASSPRWPSAALHEALLAAGAADAVIALL